MYAEPTCQHRDLKAHRASCLASWLALLFVGRAASTGLGCDKGCCCFVVTVYEVSLHSRAACKTSISDTVSSHFHRGLSTLGGCHASLHVKQHTRGKTQPTPILNCPISSPWIQFSTDRRIESNCATPHSPNCAPQHPPAGAALEAPACRHRAGALRVLRLKAGRMRGCRAIVVSGRRSRNACMRSVRRLALLYAMLCNACRHISRPPLRLNTGRLAAARLPSSCLAGLALPPAHPLCCLGRSSGNRCR